MFDCYDTVCVCVCVCVASRKNIYSLVYFDELLQKDMPRDAITYWDVCTRPRVTVRAQWNVCNTAESEDTTKRCARITVGNGKLNTYRRVEQFLWSAIDEFLSVEKRIFASFRHANECFIGGRELGRISKFFRQVGAWIAMPQKDHAQNLKKIIANPALSLFRVQTHKYTYKHTETHTNTHSRY